MLGFFLSSQPLNEQAVNATSVGYSSGGGFSAIFSQPSYQTNFVQQYLSNQSALPDQSLFNASNRAFPDLPAMGIQGMLVFNQSYSFCLGNECETSVVNAAGGTSFSAPIIASLFSMLISEHQREKKLTSGSGPLNPLIYSLPADMLLGDNRCITCT